MEERGEGSDDERWGLDRVVRLVPVPAFVANWLQSFKGLPPCQQPVSFGIDQVIEKRMEGIGGRN